MVTDLVIVGVLAFLIWRGASLGFFRSLVGPLAFIIATAAAFYYYSLTKNVMVSLGIGLLGPFLVSWALSMALSAFSDTSPSLLSQVLGAAVTVTWGMVFILPILFVLTFIPASLYSGLPALRQDIQNSKVFILLKPLSDHFNPIPSSTASAPAPAAAAAGKPSAAVQNLLQDKRMQDILNDPVLIKAAQDKNYAAFISSPKFMAIAQDPEMVKKLLSAYKDLQH